MERLAFSSLWIGLAFILLTGACTPIKKEVPETSLPTTCIQGMVHYRLPPDAAPAPYARVKVAAWRHGTEQAMAETETDETGRYCIQVPMTPSGVDLRVWGMRTVGYDQFICKGSADGIDLGTVSKKCGSGDRLTIDIPTECTQYVSPRRRN